MDTRLPVGLLGATGAIGQTYVSLLENHPQFKLEFIAGKTPGNYRERVSSKWLFNTPPPILPVFPLDALEEAQERCILIFSALPDDQAKVYDIKYASAGFPVISSSSVHRMEKDTPIIIPEINPSHIALIPEQQKNRRWKNGFIVCKPNCTLQSFLIPLTPLHRHFHVSKLTITMMQALSGTGLNGPSAFLLFDNVDTHLPEEEEKCLRESKKIWGTLSENSIQDDDSFSFSVQCNRIPVLHGHLASISVAFKEKPKKEDILEIWNHFPSLHLPSSPRSLITYHNSLQLRSAREFEKGMGITASHLKECPVLDWRFVALAHNMIRGGAGGGLLLAEWLVFNNLKYLDSTRFAIYTNKSSKVKG